VPQLLALLPFAVFVTLLIAFRRSAAIAGACSAGVALILALVAFDYPAAPVALAGPAAEAVFTAASILWIIFPALCIYEYQQRRGATARIGEWLTSVSPLPQVHALLIAFFFGLFLEGAAGFGTPIALAAPMLVGLGFPPLRALVLALFGHAAGVSFGAVGTPMVPLVDALPGAADALSLVIIVLHALLGWSLAALVFALAGRDAPATGARWSMPFLAAALFFAPAAALAWWTGPELPTLGGALVGAVLFVLLLKRGGSAKGATDMRALAGAALPYLAVLALILVTRLVPDIAAALRGPSWDWRFGGRFEGSIAPLYHPGTILLGALLLAALANRGGRSVLGPSVASAGRRLGPVALALVAVLLLAQIMVHSGMIDTLAQAAAALMGSAWPLAAPLLGALGSFVTGSATASNIVLVEFQLSAAAASGAAPLLALAGQGFGAGIGNIVAPHNIVAGAATVGLVGREGDVLKQTLPVCLAYALAGGALLLALAQLGPILG
jgi:lactate permease